MKLKVTLIGLGLILCGITQAQVSKESFIKAVDLLNCKTVELTLLKENIQQYQEECPCNETNYEHINSFLKSVGKQDVTIELSNEVQSLKKSFKENWKKEDVVSFLSEGIFTDVKYQKIIAFANKRKTSSEFKKYKTNLKSVLTNILEENIQQLTSTTTNSNVQQSNYEDRLIELERNQNTEKEDSKILGDLADYFILFSILLGIVALILSMKKSNNNNNELSNEIKNYVRNKIDNSILNNSPKSNNLSSEDPFKRITDLEYEISKLKDKIYSSNFDANFTPKITQQPYQEIKQSDVRPEIFFLSSPNSDGSFDENSASLTYKEGATIYRFTKTSNNKANFQIDEKEASIKLALQYRDKRIDPVCEATNAFNQSKHITTIQHGEAELQIGKWIVNKKAKIKYEN